MTLDKPLKFDRVPSRREFLAAGAAVQLLATPDAEKSQASPTGGKWGAGMLKRVSLCSRGEALGHGFWVDSIMLEQITHQLSAAGRIKSRFTHPDWCADGTGKALGTIDNPSNDENQAYGDLSFYSTAHRQNGPNGDLAGYVIALATEDPQASGLSIVFRHDREAEDAFQAEHTELVELKDNDGNVVDTFEQFMSPDPLNVENLPHARILELYAADFVDEPAANPNGLFHRENKLASEGRQLLDFVLGRSESTPNLSALGVAPDRLKAFVNQYLSEVGFHLEGDMPPVKRNLAKDAAKQLGMPQNDDKKDKKDAPADGDGGGDTDGDGKHEPCDAGGDDGDEGDEDEPEDGGDTDPDPNEPEDGEENADEMRSGLAEYCSVFGHDRGAKYFLAKKSMTVALKEELGVLRKELDEANKKLAAVASCGIDPLKFNAAPDGKGNGEGSTEATPGGQQLSNRDKFTALNGATVEPRTK